MNTKELVSLVTIPWGSSQNFLPFCLIFCLFCLSHGKDPQTRPARRRYTLILWPGSRREAGLCQWHSPFLNLLSCSVWLDLSQSTCKGLWPPQDDFSCFELKSRTTKTIMQDTYLQWLFLCAPPTWNFLKKKMFFLSTDISNYKKTMFIK